MESVWGGRRCPKVVVESALAASCCVEHLNLKSRKRERSSPDINLEVQVTIRWAADPKTFVNPKP